MLDHSNYGEKCDVWSAGVIMHILLIGEPPFSGDKDIDVLKNVLHGKLAFKSSLWKNITEAAVLLLEKMLERDVSKRLSMVQVMEHRWFKAYLQ